MMSARWHKSPHVLVSPLRDEPGLRILHRRTGQVLQLAAGPARAWERWDTSALGCRWPRALERLRDLGMMVTADEWGGGTAPDVPPEDGLRPRIASAFVKWYAESADCVVLFNTGPMSRSNPLLVLGPRGTLCWRLVLAGRPVGAIRAEALRVFGRDGVVPFLVRLAKLGFLRPLPRGTGDAGTGPDSAIEEFPAPEVQAQLPRTGVPWYCLWEICTICDLRCRACYLPEFGQPGPSSRRALARARQLAEAGVFYVALLGGEPLLRNDLEAIIGELRSREIFVKLITNGLRLDVSRVRSLAAAGLNQVEVSFDGLTRASHEASRGPGTFEAARRAVAQVREGGVPRCAVIWTVHSENWAEVRDLAAFLDDLAVDECYLSGFRRTGLGSSHAPWEPLAAGALAQLQREVVEIARRHPRLQVTLPQGCSCGRSSVVVGPEGGVRTCPFSRREVGSLDAQPLARIWASLDASHRGWGPFGICGAETATARAAAMP